jgi:hypothetical protein
MKTRTRIIYVTTNIPNGVDYRAYFMKITAGQLIDAWQTFTHLNPGGRRRFGLEIVDYSGGVDNAI